MNTVAIGWMLALGGAVLSFVTCDFRDRQSADVVTLALLGPLLYLLNLVWPYIYRVYGSVVLLYLEPLIAGTIITMVKYSLCSISSRQVFSTTNIALYVLFDYTLLTYKVFNTDYTKTLIQSHSEVWSQLRELTAHVEELEDLMQFELSDIKSIVVRLQTVARRQQDDVVLRSSRDMPHISHEVLPKSKPEVNGGLVKTVMRLAGL